MAAGGRFLTSGEPGVNHGPPRPFGSRTIRYSVREEPAVERIIRPFETPPGWPGNRRLPPEQDDKEAFIQWSANINTVVTTLDSLGIDEGYLIKAIFEDQPTSETSEEPPAIVYNEVRRSVSVIRVSNPEDPSSWVDVERVERATFTRDGEQVTFVFRNRDPAPYPPVIYI